MSQKIESGELWDRLALVLGDDAVQLPPRPSAPQPYKFMFGGTFTTDWMGDRSRNHEAVGRVIGSLKSCAKHIVLGEISERAAVQESSPSSVFHAIYEHSDDTGRGTSTEVRFTAEDEYDAISSAVRFWMGRQAAIPDFFNHLYCVKIWRERFGSIADDGAMFNGSSFPIFEWKIDAAGVALEIFVLEWIAERIEAEVRRDALTSS